MQHTKVAYRGIQALALVVVTIAAFMPAYSAPVSQGEDTHYPKVLRHMIDAGTIRVLKQFPTAKDGLTGYIVQRGSYQTVVYSADGYLFVGPLFGPNGHNLSKQYARQYKPELIAQTIDSLDPDYLITQGNPDAPTLYAFIDPNCIYCHKLYRRVQPLVTSGRLQVHWVMVGVLGQSSIGRSAAILASADPAAALAKNEAGFREKVEQGGIAPIQPSDTLADVLQAHRQAMFAIGGSGTPTIAFITPQGQWHAVVGLPPKKWLVAFAQQSGRG